MVRLEGRRKRFRQFASMERGEKRDKTPLGGRRGRK